MSLLLFFNNSIPVASTSGSVCWADTTAPTTGWSISDYDFLNTWDEWDTYTYTQIQAQGLTWQNLAGDRFSIVSTPTTTWVVSTLPAENCA